MITKSEITKLLARAAVSDRRTVGENDVEGWFETAQMRHWTYPAARRIIVEHYASGAGKPRIEEANITDRLRALRSAAAANFRVPHVPDELPGRDYPKWYRAQLNAHIERVMDEWVMTGKEPDTIAIDSGVGKLAIESAPDHIRPHVRHWDQIGLLPPRREKKPPTRTRRFVGDPDHRARAVAELEAKRAEGETAS